ncbi:creatininase family protein [Georgenia sp. TF02-10]|uniref:creatininase family protein n=1 Tax=Georgenia sp. TF02-10 TaxID=2917725 RepID=UPI001FA7D98A|nr:creatininase family protein [Georgenia sp. TF02-10]UNX54613.1 creatininase family protein [Georgenia sp. TF02-10]
MTLLAEMTRDELAARMAERPIAILPIGATEQHGHHLPLGTDSFLAEEYARRIGDRVDGIVLPTVPFGYSWVWKDTPGTVTVGHRTLEAYLGDVVESAERSGFGMLVIADGHESNVTTMKYVVRDHAARSSFPVLRLFYPKLSEILAEHLESETWHGMIHACEFETSLLLDARPDLVDMAKAVREYPPFSEEYAYGAEQLGNVSESGVFGDPTLATAAKGRAMFDALVEESVRIIQKARAR